MEELIGYLEEENYKSFSLFKEVKYFGGLFLRRLLKILLVETNYLKFGLYDTS